MSPPRKAVAGMKRGHAKGIGGDNAGEVGGCPGRGKRGDCDRGIKYGRVKNVGGHREGGLGRDCS